jgi:hypothetical protein
MEYFTSGNLVTVVKHLPYATASFMEVAPSSGETILTPNTVRELL